ncbi:phospholipase-like protein [Tanacetum coccineum]|uniref:Phospholipase-like protein n=1 Tax=Tanacetum coccineum TaxID=301880 RepID=A0ABQ5IBN6_9ASTR
MSNPPDIFDAKVSLRSKMHLLSTIKEEFIFIGREEFLNALLHILTLVEDLFAWDAYPWGEYMWKYFYQWTLNVVPKHVEMHIKLKNQSGKKMATYNLNGFVWALKIWILESYPNSMLWWSKQPDIIPRGLAWSNFKKFEKTDYHCLFGQLTPTNKELKEPWLIRSLSYIRGEDASFIQAVRPGENVDEAPIVYEQSVEINDHDPAATTKSNNLLDDVDLLFKEVMDVRPDLAGRVDELSTKLVQNIPSNSQQGSLQHLLNALEPELPPDVSCLQLDNMDEPHFDATVKDNAKMEHTMDVDNEDGKYCLDDMSIGFKEDTSNGEIKVTLYQHDHKPLCNKMDVVVEEKTPVTESSPVIETKVVDSTLKCVADVIDTANMTVAIESHSFELHQIKNMSEENIVKVNVTPLLKIGFRVLEVDVEEQEKLELIEYSVESISPFSEVYFPLNEPELHWALAKLHICTGVTIIYDSMTPQKRNKDAPIVENRKWWLDTRETMSKQLPLFLDKIRVLTSKGLLVREYKITYQFEENFPHQGAVYGDCGVWVYILLYILTHKLPLVFGDPLQVALAYRERMLAYF